MSRSFVSSTWAPISRDSREFLSLGAELACFPMSSSCRVSSHEISFSWSLSSWTVFCSIRIVHNLISKWWNGFCQSMTGIVSSMTCFFANAKQLVVQCGSGDRWVPFPKKKSMYLFVTKNASTASGCYWNRHSCVADQERRAPLTLVLRRRLLDFIQKKIHVVQHHFFSVWSFVTGFKVLFVTGDSFGLLVSRQLTRGSTNWRRDVEWESAHEFGNRIQSMSQLARQIVSLYMICNEKTRCQNL